MKNLKVALLQLMPEDTLDGNIKRSILIMILGYLANKENEKRK